jgi:hypothetical protein
MGKFDQISVFQTAIPLTGDALVRGVAAQTGAPEGARTGHRATAQQGTFNVRFGSLATDLR